VSVAELHLPAHNEVDEEAVGQFIISMPLPKAGHVIGIDMRIAIICLHPDSHWCFVSADCKPRGSSTSFPTRTDPSVSCNLEVGTGLTPSKPVAIYLGLSALLVERVGGTS